MPDQPQSESVVDRIAKAFGVEDEPQPEYQQGDPQITEDQQVEEPVTEESEEIQEAAPELAEVEYNGKTYKVDPELREAVMLKADYTQKTQEIASVRRTLEIEKAALQANQLFNQQVGQLNQELSRLNSIKEQAERIDRNSLNTDQRLDLDYELRKIDRQIAALDGQISQQRDSHKNQFNQMVAAAVMESEKFMSRKVPGWSQETGKSLHEYGLQMGIPVEKLTTGWFSDPTATHVMWKAQQWDKLQASKPSVANKVGAAPPVSKPGAVNPMPQSVRDKFAYKKAMGQAKTSQDKAKIIEQRLANMFK